MLISFVFFSLSAVVKTLIENYRLIGQIPSDIVLRAHVLEEEEVEEEGEGDGKDGDMDINGSVVEDTEKPAVPSRYQKLRKRTGSLSGGLQSVRALRVCLRVHRLTYAHSPPLLAMV